MTELMRWRAVIYMVALFAAGAITGAAVRSHMAATPASQALKVGRADEISKMIREKLNTRLNLTPEQSEKFKPCVQRASQELESSHLDCLKRVSAAIDLMHAQILPDLTADQKEKLKQLEAERVASWHEKYNFSLDVTRTNAP